MFKQVFLYNGTPYLAFKNDEGDAITTDDSLLQGLVMENNDYIILPNRLTKEPYGIAFKKSGQTKNLKNIINEIINETRYTDYIRLVY